MFGTCSTWRKPGRRSGKSNGSSTPSWRWAGLKKRVIRPGAKYRHFKGKEYRVLYVARHSETLEEMVVYQQLYGEMGVWVRPLEMFLGTVDRDGTTRYRFEEIED